MIDRPDTPAGAPQSAPSRTADGLGRDFHAHLGTVALNALAGGTLFAGMPLVAATLTDSPQEISLLSAATQLPALAGVLVGLIVDRTDRRRLRLVMMLLRVALLLTLAGVALLGELSIPVLVAVVLLYSLAGVFIAAANGAMVPQLVPRSRLTRANSRVQAAMFVFEDIVGAPIAALLALLGAAWIFGLPAAFTVGAVLMLWLGLRGRRFHAEPPAGQEPTPTPTGPLRRAGADIADGLRFLAGHPILRPIFCMALVANFASASYFAVFVLWMTGPDSPVGVPAAVFPLYFTIMALGALTATATVGSLLKVVAEFPLMIAGFWGMPVLLVVQVVWPHPVVMAVVMLLLGYTLTVGNVIAVSLSQKLVPGHMLGRFAGTSQTATSGLAPLGAVLGGVVAEQAGFGVLHLAAAVLLGLSLLYPMFAVRQSDVERMTVLEEEAASGGAAPAGGEVSPPRP